MYLTIKVIKTIFFFKYSRNPTQPTQEKFSRMRPNPARPMGVTQSMSISERDSMARNRDSVDEIFREIAPGNNDE